MAVELIDIVENWGRGIDPNLILVKYESGVSADSEEGERIRDLVESRFDVFQTESGSESLNVFGYRRIECGGLNEVERSQLIDTLREHRLVESVTQNHRIELSVVPDDPQYKFEWGLEAIDAPEGWKFETDSREVIVAVVDTGIDYRHPDLAANLWTNPGEIAGNGIDDDGNGFVDDVHGYDFGDDDGDIMDTYGHGTHVSGIIGAVGNNGVGISGVSWRADIMGVKVMNSRGAIYFDALVEGIAYAVEMGALVINVSLGGGWYDASLKQIIDFAESQGVVVVVSAGNDYRSIDAVPKYPASFLNENILAVGASDSSDRVARFSNYGSRSVDLFAPGRHVLSLVPGAGYRYCSGTSMAAPFVSGAIALAYADLLEEGGSVREVVEAVIGATRPVSSLKGWSRSNGVLNLGKLLRKRCISACSEKEYFSSSSFEPVVEVTIPYSGEWKIGYSFVSAPGTGGNGQAEFKVGERRIGTVFGVPIVPRRYGWGPRLMQGSKRVQLYVEEGAICSIDARSFGGANCVDLARIDLAAVGSESVRIETPDFPRECVSYTYWNTQPWYWVPYYDGVWQNIAYLFHVSPEPGRWLFEIEADACVENDGEISLLVSAGERGISKEIVGLGELAGKVAFRDCIEIETTEQTAFVKVVLSSIEDIEINSFRSCLRKAAFVPVVANRLCSFVRPGISEKVCAVSIPERGDWLVDLNLAAVSYGGGAVSAELWVGGGVMETIEARRFPPVYYWSGMSLLQVQKRVDVSTRGSEDCVLKIRSTRNPVRVNLARMILSEGEVSNAF
ncbi:S8 family peptidase [Pelagicoccus mobilis]|uniref:S8 family serine peptidase n=1 Tax=Pelagicoccus mobilis TaxID=415221 RepID=A0A934S262_9BACT|nr:S8 family peptidase [Pelagicoccus mobilis]MBK1879256.1 S8 family serine peptidase [Pelagicoccus mobilis]